MKEKTCEECGAKISDQENSGTNGHPICGLCFDELHTPQIDEFSDADNGL
jgi:formylmethanofuran dehydrogenase subunit E